MIKYLSLIGLSISYLKDTFNEAFSDYTVPMKLTDEQIRTHLEANDYDPKLSIGAFDGEKMVGFVFVGYRGNRLYDAGTAVIKEYRRQGIARTMIKAIISKMNRDDVFILECISSNERGMKLYESLGFKRNRHFICFKLKGVGELSNEVIKVENINIEKDYHPSWQNEKIGDHLLFKHNNNYLCVRNDGGVYFSDADEVLIKHVLYCLGKLSFTNVNSNDNLVQTLTLLGATLYVEQEEMIYESN